MADIEKVIKGLECEEYAEYARCNQCPYVKFHKCKTLLMRDAIALLKEQRKKGHWIEKEDYNMETYYDCSVCGESWTTIEGTPWENGMNYCPHCGADMR